jgi:hypothetical protein
MFWVFGVVSVVLAADSSTTVTADVVRIDENRVDAHGDVAVIAGVQQLRADVVRFERAPDGRLSFEAEQLWWTPCTCERPPWAITATEGKGTFGEELRLREAALEVCGVPVVPVPWLRLPLNPRRPRLLIPEVGVGEYGGRIATPVWLPVGARSGLIVAPEVRSDREFRQRFSGEGPLGKASLEVGRSEETGATEGMIEARGGLDDGRMRLAVDSRLVTDPTVTRAYANDFMARSSPYAEQLMVAAVGPVRLESNTFDRGPYQRPLGAVLSVAGEAMGPVSVTASTRMDWVEIGEEAHQLDRGAATLTMDSAASMGPFEGALGVNGRAAQWSDGGPWTEGQIRSAVFLPVWGEVGPWVQVAELGMEMSLAQAQGALEDRFGWLEPSPRWAMGPVLRSTFIGRHGVPFSSELRVMRTPNGWLPVGTVHGMQGPWSGRLQADLDLQAARFAYAGERLNGGLGGVRGNEILQSYGDVRLLVAAGLSPGWAGLFDHQEQGWARQGPQLSWDSGCDCLSLDARVEWARDQERPDAMIRMDLRPRRAGDRKFP